MEGAIRTRHLNIWKPRGFVQLPVDRCLPAPGVLGSLSLIALQSLQCGGRRGATRKRFVTSQVTGPQKGPTVYVLVRYTYKALTPGFDKVVLLGRARRWIFESWLVGLLRCRLVLRHARVPWSCFSRACYFRHDVKPCQ